jgi:hypothetical protein
MNDHDCSGGPRLIATAEDRALDGPWQSEPRECGTRVEQGYPWRTLAQEPPRIGGQADEWPGPIEARPTDAVVEHRLFTETMRPGSPSGSAISARIGLACTTDHPP